jgi:hypothetical protein
MTLVFVSKNPFISGRVLLVLKDRLHDLQSGSALCAVDREPHTHVQKSPIRQFEWCYGTDLSADEEIVSSIASIDTKRMAARHYRGPQKQVE